MGRPWARFAAQFAERNQRADVAGTDPELTTGQRLDCSAVLARWWAPTFLGRLQVRRPSGQVGNGRAKGGGVMTTTTTGSTDTSSYPASAVPLGRMFSSEGVPRDE
jgi:hypothetical protein